MASTASNVLRLLTLFALASCSGLEPVTTSNAVTDPARLYMSLTLDYHAVNLSTAEPHNTIQLTATPRDGMGAAMTDLPAPIFYSRDTAAVHVTEDGLVTARQAATMVTVVAELVTDGPVRHLDSVFVNVTDPDSPVLASFSIDPVPPDSAVWFIKGNNSGVGQFLLNRVGAFPTRLSAVVLDNFGNPITGLAIQYTSLDTAIASMRIGTNVDDNHRVAVTRNVNGTPLRPGQARLVARTVAYGDTLADTVTVTVRLPIVRDVFAEVNAGTGAVGFTPSEVRIVPGGSIYWMNRLGAPVDVTFDDSTNVVEGPTAVCNALLVPPLSGIFGPGHCGAGNVLIPVLGEGMAISTTVQIRQFPVPGVYPYHSTSTGATGRVVVGDAAP